MKRALATIFGVFGLVLLAVFGVFFFFGGEPPWAVLASGIGCVIVWLGIDGRNLLAASEEQGARYTAMALVLVFVAAGITVALNLVANRYDDRLDLTESGVYTLSDQTRKVLEGLDQPIEIVGFFPEATPERGRFDDLTAGYDVASDVVDVSVYDPLRSPLKADEYKVTSQYGTVILVSGDSQQRIEGELSEEALTNAIVRLTAAEKHRICVVVGHRELDIEDDYSPSGIGAAVTKLQGQNYEVEKVNLARAGTVPEACEVLLSPDPQTDFLPAEREIVARYLAEGGAWLLLLDPTHAPLLARDMARYGIAVGNDIIVEQDPSAQVAGMDPSYIVVDMDSGDLHTITQASGGMALFRVARSVARASEQVEGIQVQEVLKTSVHGWGERTLDMSKALAPDPGEDLLGPVPMMVVAEIADPAVIEVASVTRQAGDGPDYPAIVEAVETEGTAEGAQAEEATELAVERAAGGRIVVVGDSDFASNELIDQLANNDLFLNTVAWLVREEDQLAIRSRDTAPATLTLTGFQSLILWVLCLLVGPGFAALGALLTWRARRSR